MLSYKSTFVNPEEMKTYTSSVLQKIPYSLSPEVYLVSQEDNAYLLDLERGKFYGLDPIAHIMLSFILEKNTEDTVSEITKTYGVTPEQVQSDLKTLLEDLEKKQLLNTTPTHLPIPSAILKTLATMVSFAVNPSPEPNYLTVSLLLILSNLSFRLLGWSRTLWLWQQWHNQDKVAPKNIPNILDKVDRLVREAAINQPVVCRERALVGYHLLHVYYGIPAELVLGFNMYPFLVHAWVEWQGRIITDDAEHCQTFTEVTRYP